MSKAFASVGAFLLSLSTLAGPPLGQNEADRVLMWGTFFLAVGMALDIVEQVRATTEGHSVNPGRESSDNYS